MRFVSVIRTAILYCLMACVAGTSFAAEVWSVRSGVTTVYFNEDLLRDLGLEVSPVEQTAAFPPEMEYRVERPNYSFSISKETDFRFSVEHGVALPYGVIGGALRHRGAVTLSDRSGTVQKLPELVFTAMPRGGAGPDDHNLYDTLLLSDPRSGEVVFVVEHSMFDLRPESHVLWIHYMNLRFADEWARRVGRPELAGLVVGMAEVIAQVDFVSGTSEGEPYAPQFIGNLDVSLGALSQIQQVAHDGTYPGGTAALSMATTACNLGDTDVPWLAPMAENHPVIAMALYRLWNGRFEQIGVSWMKHGFYALSNSQCQTCQHPSNGTFLGVGCSDTYGVVNNGDRNYLGPRSEVNPFTAAWTCRGSHFSGGVDDCVRRHGGSGHGPLDHRLVAQDADLNLPGATYFYEADYLVRDDQNAGNNIGSKACTMSWNGSTWDFVTPSAGNPLLEGPAVNRFGDLRTMAAADSTDGHYILAVKTTDLGGGIVHYEYALFNRNSDLGVHLFHIPVGDAAVTNIGFHDSDADPLNDWQVTLENGVLTWRTDNQETNPGANALGFDRLFNFRFDADRPPSDAEAVLSLFKPHEPREFPVITRGPVASATVAMGPGPAEAVLHPARPNPVGVSTRIGFARLDPGPARLEVFDPQGRRVRVLSDSEVGAGPHEVVWDGTDGEGRRVNAGVYYYRLQAGRFEAVRSLVVLD